MSANWIQTHGSKAFDFNLLMHGTAEDLEHDLDDGEREELLEHARRIGLPMKGGASCGSC